MENLNNERQGVFENIPARSKNEIIDCEIEMVNRNRFLDEDEKDKIIKRLLAEKEV